MKTMKKLLTLALVLMMVVSAAVPAMATGVEGNDLNDTGSSTNTYTITIMSSKTNNVAESGAGHTYEAYQILTGTKKAHATDASKVNFSVTGWGANVNGDALLNALKSAPEFGGNTGDNVFSSVTDAVGFAGVLSGLTTAQVEIVADYINKNLTGTPAVSTAKGYNTTDEKYEYTITVPLGYYLVKDKNNSLNAENKDYTDLILHVSRNVTVYHKGSVPTVAKTVSEYNVDYVEAIEVAMNKEYYYKLVATLPSDFASYDKYFLEFIDTLSAGIDFVSIVEVYALRTDGGDHENLLPDTQSNHGYHVTEPTDTNRVLKISFEDLKHDNEHELEGGDKIVVIYKAKLNENAVVGGQGNINTVKLNYSNDPNSTGKGFTTTDGAKVYTFGIEVTKKDGQTNAPLDGVKFRLYHYITRNSTSTPADDGTSQQAHETIKEYAIISNGEITGWTEDATAASELVTVNGKFSIEGLDTNVYYYLEETSWLDGYRPLNEPVRIYLSANINTEGFVTYVNMNEDSQANITGHYTDGNRVILGVAFDVPNYAGAVLPETGGVGTTLFYIFGSIMVLAAIALLVTKKRMA